MYLIVGPESSLPGVGPSRTSARSGGKKASVGGIAQNESVSIGRESNDELLSGGTIVFPVVHDIVLQW